MPRVLNINRDEIPSGAVFVDRRTKWGNPTLLENESDRDWVCDEYEKFLRKNDVLLSQLHELRGKDLICNCAPKRCHADTLLRLANPPYCVVCDSDAWCWGH